MKKALIWLGLHPQAFEPGDWMDAEIDEGEPLTFRQQATELLAVAVGVVVLLAVAVVVLA